MGDFDILLMLKGRVDEKRDGVSSRAAAFYCHISPLSFPSHQPESSGERVSLAAQTYVNDAISLFSFSFFARYETPLFIKQEKTSTTVESIFLCVL